MAYSIFFMPIKQVVRDGKSLALLMIATPQLEALSTTAQAAGGEITFAARSLVRARSPSQRLHLESHNALGHEG